MGDISGDWMMVPKGENCCYVDMGLLYNAAQSKCINWQNSTFDKAKLDAFLQPIFAQLNKEGTESIDLSFAQIRDIDALSKQEGTPLNLTDTIMAIFQYNYPVGDTKKDFLAYFNDYAIKNNVKVTLSFGGAVAAAEDMKLSKDPVQEAKTLVSFMEKYQFDSLDFDLEGAGAQNLIAQNGEENTIAFLQELHKTLSAKGGKMTITVMGALSSGPTGPLKPIFDKLDTMFDGVNLMLYNGQYYIDVDNASWGLKQWREHVPANMLNIGFFDRIDYTSASSSGSGKGWPNMPKGLKNGEAAAWIFLEVQKEMGETFGEPFFWTTNPVSIPRNLFIEEFRDYVVKNAPLA